MLNSLLTALVTVVFMYTPGPGRWTRHQLLHAATKSARRRGKFTVGLRVVDGVYEGLGPKWRVGTALLRTGRVEFTRSGLVTRRPVPWVVVDSVGAAERISGFGRLRLDPDCQVARLTTPGAVLEMAVWPPGPAEEVLARLR